MEEVDDPNRPLERACCRTTGGDHRAEVGGFWETLGPLISGYLIGEGLRPENSVLDIGCGCLRIGVRLVEYLEEGNYYGLDASRELLEAGYAVELAALDLQNKLPRENLVADDEFDFGKLAPATPFDAALAQSVFTHLPLGHLRLCLARLAEVMRPGGIFYATFFLVDGVQAWLEPALHEPGGITTHPLKDPYHHTLADLIRAAEGLPWLVDGPHEIDHPRAQVMVRFVRAESDVLERGLGKPTGGRMRMTFDP